MIEKKCKECGKIFIAMSARQLYCSADHYRPCPVCQKPVLIKYLSDPTPRCADCRKANASASSAKKEQVVSQQIPKPEHQEDVQFQDVREYIGSPHPNYFIPGHQYALDIVWTGTCYEVSSFKDVSDDVVVDIMSPFSSQISINRNFVKCSL